MGIQINKHGRVGEKPFKGRIRIPGTWNIGVQCNDGQFEGGRIQPFKFFGFDGSQTNRIAFTFEFIKYSFPAFVCIVNNQYLFHLFLAIPS